MFYATQTFSKTVAQLWRVVFPNRPVEADFIELMNDLFDLFNTRTLRGRTPATKPFGMELERQMDILDKAEKEILGLRVCGKEFMLPFQRGYLMSIYSLKALYHDMSGRSGYVSLEKPNVTIKIKIFFFSLQLDPQGRALF